MSNSRSAFDCQPLTLIAVDQDKIAPNRVHLEFDRGLTEAELKVIEDFLSQTVNKSGIFSGFNGRMS